MTAEERARMFELCKLIQDEKDPAKFNELLEQLNAILDVKRERIEKADSAG